MKKGKLIVLEGIDGCGKGTQLKLLVEKLTIRGFPVEVVDFPQYDETFFGKTVGRFLKGDFGELSQIHPSLPSILYAADRWQAKEMINQWLGERKVIVANRYSTTSLAFQGARVGEEGREGFIKWLEEMEYEVFGIPREDLVVLLNIPAEIGRELLERKGNRGYLGGSGKDINEKDFGYQCEVRDLYLKLARERNWRIIECCKEGKLMSPEAIHDLVFQTILQELTSDESRREITIKR